MPGPIFSKVYPDGPKNAVLTLSGELISDEPPTDVLLWNALSPPARAIRIESIVFAIQEKMGLHLYWKTEKGYELILPLESRGMLDFNRVQGLHSPMEALGLAISSFLTTESKSFLVMLDITKQRT